MTISRVNKCQLPFLALVLNTITPPQHHHNHHAFTHTAANKTREGAQKGTEMGEGQVYQVRPLYFFTYFYFLWFSSTSITLSLLENAPSTQLHHADESLIELAMYFRNWHMFREYMNNIAC